MDYISSSAHTIVLSSSMAASAVLNMLLYSSSWVSLPTIESSKELTASRQPSCGTNSLAEQQIMLKRKREYDRIRMNC